MKILITTDLYTTQTNGVVTSVKNLTAELIARGHEVRILTVADGVHSSRIGNVYYIRSLPIGAIYPDVRMPTSYHHRLIRELIAWKPDVVHSQCEFFTYQFARHISKETGAPLIHTYHTLYEQYARYILPLKGAERGVGGLSRVRLKNARCIIAPTRKVENVLRGYGITVPIRVVPSGICLEQHKIRFSSEVRAERRAELGIGPDTFVLVNIGRLGNEKKLDDLIRYFAKEVGAEADVRFLIVGDGPAHEQLQKLAKELGVAERVIFTGMVAPDRVQEYYQLGDLFVGASTSETQGLTYVEAAANGLPLLCREDPCLMDILEEGKNGYQFTDGKTFGRYLRQIMAAPQWCASASKHSEALSARFSTDAFGASVEGVYRQFVKAPVC